MTFDGWTTCRLADGVGLFPPGGAREGSVRIRDRRRPLRTTGAIRDRAVAAIGDVRQLGPIERLSTNEGELAAITTTRLEAGEHTLGLIFGDDFYTQLDVFTARAESFGRTRELARDLLSRYMLGLGRERMRRPFYQPPEGWSGYPRGLSTTWYPPGFPADPTAITVSPATPLSWPAGALSELSDPGGGGPLASVPIQTGEFVGHCAAVTRGELGKVYLRLRDESFIYGFQLDCPITSETRGRAVLERLVDSLEPIPERARTPVGDAFSCWAL